ncbi:MAG: hypothetical protein COB38_00015 [Gammaproteobacteria bacterium]|nr:MAG: hypothetical protein COB38_00015 [Gammaproteobacteria bacterium]
MDIISQYLEIATFIITILGLPAAIFVYIKEQEHQRAEREYGTFDALDAKYIEIQQLCLENPQLDVFDSPFANPIELTEQQQKQEEAILLIRISIFERAFLMYQRTRSESKQSQWDGWELEIKEWFSRKNFITTWNEHGAYFDKSFFEHFNRYISGLD